MNFVDLPSPNHEARPDGSVVDILVLHYTELPLQESLDILRDAKREIRVSSHYVLYLDGTAYRLVPEDRTAWHSGKSWWRGREALNGTSIGIEIVNLGYEDGPTGRRYLPYPEKQIDAVVALVKDIVARHKIPPDRVLGHSDIAPGRKVDPGPLFPWKRLADEGLVRWPDAARAAALRPQYEQALPDVAWFQQKLARIGYLVPLDGTLDEATRNVMASFQMKYRPARYDGLPDAECAALLAALTTP